MGPAVEEGKKRDPGSEVQAHFALCVEQNIEVRWWRVNKEMFPPVNERNQVSNSEKKLDCQVGPANVEKECVQV